MPTYIRRILLASINAMMIFPLLAQAQQGSAPGGNASAAPQAQGDQQSAQTRQQQQRRMALLAQYLNLSDDQKRQWVQIQRDTMQNVRTARRDDSLNEEQMQQRIKEIHAEQKRQLLALLTPQQQEALKKWWDEQKQKQQNKSPDAPDAVSPAGTKDDDFFAGMVQDPDPAPQAQNQNKKAPPRN